MNLKHLTDKILISDTKKLVSSEREVTVKVLHHLKEIDRRKLYSDLGFSSLYDYCVRELGYSEGSAHRRISSCRLIDEIPSISKKIESGNLNLMIVSDLAQFFKEECISDTPRKEKIIKEVEGLSRRECELKLMQLSENPIEKKHCLWIKDSVMERLKEYRDLKGTRESWEEIISDVTSTAIAELEKSKFRLVKNPRPSTLNGARTPTASVKREVYQRDKCCVKCGGKFNLQFDHRKPFSLGGKSTSENIRLLCFNCNQRERIRQRL
ncbi:MAG: HNH endonuclease signature motif containing protein [Bdellovibrionota bacterium]